jgi:Redoxin
MTVQPPTGLLAIGNTSNRAVEQSIGWRGRSKPSRRHTRRTALIMGAATLIAVRTHPAYAARTAQPVPKLVGYVGNYFPFDTPQSLPRIVFEDAAGKDLTLSVMAGRIVLLNFWATWCAPCLAELPELDRLQAYFSDSDFSVLALCTDGRSLQSVGDFLVAHHVHNLSPYVDPTGDDMHNCAITAIPTSFILNRRGQALGMLAGGAPWASAAGRALIAYYIAKVPRNPSA